MKLYVVVFGLLAACAVSLAREAGPLITALYPVEDLQTVQPINEDNQLATISYPVRSKRSLLLGGAGLLGAAALGAGAIGLGGAVLGAKAGFIGGALAGSALSHGRSYGGWGYGGGYGGYGGYYGGGYGGGYGGYGGYRSYYPTTYVVSDPWC